MRATKANTPVLLKKKTVLFWPFIAILLILSAVCFYTPHTQLYTIFNRTWGFDHILFYGTNAKFLFFFVCLVLIIPYTNNLVSIGLSRIAGKTAKLSKVKLLLFIFLSIASIYIFYLFRIKYYFLGDFNLRLMQTMKKDFLATEYLTMRTLYCFTSIGARYGYTHDQLFKLYSFIAGGFFVFISFLIADLVGKNPLQKFFFLFAHLSTALILVFCGYVEIYATPIALLNLYLYFGLRYLYSGKGLVLVAASLGIAVASHLLCLAAVPSLIILYYFNNRSKFRFITELTNKQIALRLSLLILASLIIAFKVKSNFLLTVSKPAGQTKVLTLFDYRHFWELLNGELLSCGLSLVFIFVLLAKSIREKKQLTGELYFLLSITGCFFLLVFAANLQRGSGDWDIMAFPAISMNLVTAMLIVHLYKNQLLHANYLLIAIIGINATTTFLWVHINHTDRSIQKIETMLVNDPATYYSSRISGATQLALAYTNNKLTHESERAALIACNLPGQNDIRPCVMYGLSLKDSKRLEEAKVYFEEMLQSRNKYVYEAYLYLMEYHARKSDNPKFYEVLFTFYNAFVEKPDAFMTNSKFRADVVIKLFDIIYKDAIQNKNTVLSGKVGNVIEGLKNYKPVTK